MILEKAARNEKEKKLNYDLLSVRDIYDFAQIVELDEIRTIIGRQIQYNVAVSEEGLNKDYGANIGSVLLGSYGNDVKIRAKAKAAAGSDARMNGSSLPVVINSGSGHQGMAVSLPIIEYAKDLNSDEEQLYRALVISDLTAIHQKTGIGYLSAYCGAVSAGAAAGAGILGYEMYVHGQQFHDGEGVVSHNVEDTIRNIGRLGKDGMRQTDKEILCMMTCVD